MQYNGDEAQSLLKPATIREPLHRPSCFALDVYCVSGMKGTAGVKGGKQAPRRVFYVYTACPVFMFYRWLSFRSGLLSLHPQGHYKCFIKSHGVCLHIKDFQTKSHFIQPAKNFNTCASV